MSSWSEAVWIVKKLQKNFDFTNQITRYTQSLNNTNGNVNRLNDEVAECNNKVENFNNELDRVVAQLDIKCSTISARETSNGSPEGYSSQQYAKGTIWLIQKS